MLENEPHFQVSSASLDEIKFDQGVVKRQLTLQEAEELGAVVFSMRMHLFVESKDTTRVFISVLPGTTDDLPAAIKSMVDRERAASSSLVNRPGVAGAVLQTGRRFAYFFGFIFIDSFSRAKTLYLIRFLLI